MAFLRNPVVYVPDLTNGRPIVDGKVYVLVAGTVPPTHDSYIDPLTLVQVTYENEAGNIVNAPQPLYTSKGGCLYGEFPEEARQYISANDAFVFAVYNSIGRLQYSSETFSGDYIESVDLAVSNSTVLIAGVQARQFRLIDGIKNLIAQPNVAMNVGGFYVGSDIGGGQFYYDTTRSKEDHNGVTVISPEALAGWDGTLLDIDSLFSWAGSGSGCFVKLGVSNKIKLSEAGATNGADKTKPIIAAIGAALDGFHVVDDTETGFLSGTISISGKSLTLVLGELTQTFGGRIIDYDAGLDFIRSVTSINSATRQIYMDVSGVAVGDVIKLVSDDRLAGTRPAVPPTSSRLGQYVTVLSVAADHFVSTEAIRYTYTTNIRAAKLSGKSLKLTAAKLEYDSALSGSFTAVAVKNGVRDEIDVVFGKLPFVGISTFGCYKPWVKRAHFLRNPLSSPNGHGVSDWSCYGGVYEHLSAESCRHLFTTNQQPIEANSSDIWAYGPSYGGVVRLDGGSGEFSTWADTHHGCEDFVFYGGNYVGYSSAVAVRGRRITWHGAQVYGSENGIFAYSESTLDPSDYSEDIVFVSPVVRGITAQPIRAQRVRRMRVDNPVVHDVGVSVGSFIAADVAINNLTAYLNGTSDANQSIFLAQDVCSLKLNGKTEINITNQTGADPRLFSDIGTGGSTFVASDLTINNAGADFVLKVANNVAATAMTMQANIELNGVTDWTALETGSLTAISRLDLIGSIVLRTNRRRSATVTASTVILQGFFSGAENFLFDGNASGGAATVTGIENGRFDGQILVCRNAGANSWSIPNGGNTANIGSATITLTARQTASYVWDSINSTWKQFS